MNDHLKTVFTKTPEEITAEILGRFSVTDLIEQTDADLARGEEMYLKHGGSIEIIDQGETNLIRWWTVRTPNGEYSVRRFENFIFCSCLDFYFSRKVCKHTVPTTNSLCSICRTRDVATLGDACEKCSLGGELEPGDHFKVDCRSYKKASIFRVESVSIDGIKCVDISEPESSVVRTTYDWRHFQVDGLRQSRQLKMLPPEFGRGEASQLKAA